ncbi:MAG TPA: phosphoribosylaminoimidazolesuccinocarboxamide synthase [Nitrososphaeraceae archaeon]|nr:phosphoribosylaminoimidazolesuccinocarboxamide synthase [Nitrososphaeraceae archaeon]
MKLIHKGKVKDVYQSYNEDDNNLLFVFSNRISAFDVAMEQEIPRKGEILCKFAKFWFENLNVDNHMIKTIDNNKMLVEKLSMIPIECVVRGYFYGSLVDRYNDNKIDMLNSPDFHILSHDFDAIIASKLSEPLFDATTKSFDHDLPISKNKIISSNLLSENDFNFLRNKSIKLYQEMSQIIETAGFIIADVKFEFGFDKKGEIILGDSLGPDEYRIWNKESYQKGLIQESYDKQILRDWLTKIGFKQKVKEYNLHNQKPKPPQLPLSIIKKILDRYIYSYEKITGNKFE